MNRRPILDEIVAAAVDVTAATVGWLLMVDGDELVAVAAAGGAAPGDRVGRRVAQSGIAGLVVSAGEPVSMKSPPGDSSNDGAGGLDGNPSAVLAAPCGDEDVIGVLELAAPQGGEPFTIDDIEEITLLARVAGVALAELEVGQPAPTPAQLAGELTRVQQQNPVRYAAIARMLEAVLGQG